MKKLFIGVVVLGAALLAPRFARAHEGHDHTVMGTIASIDGMNLMVKTGDGKQTMVMMDAKTKITRGTAKADAEAGYDAWRSVLEFLEVGVNAFR